MDPINFQVIGRSFVNALTQIIDSNTKALSYVVGKPENKYIYDMYKSIYHLVQPIAC